MTKIISSPSFFIGKKEDGTISFGSGQSDLMPPSSVFELLTKIRPQSFQYTPVRGLLPLREMLAQNYSEAVADNFVITNGASEALDLTLRCLIKNDRQHKKSSRSTNQTDKSKVLIPLPYYYSYPHNVRFAGLEVEYYRLKEGVIDIVDVKQKLTDHHVMAIIINSPSNPTGTVQPIQILKEIERLAAHNSLYVISDEVYKDIIYERENYLIAGDKIITINSFSKTFSMCGIRIGYLYSCNQEFIDGVIEMKTHTSMNTNTIAQEMALAALHAPLSYLEEQMKIWRQRRDILYQGLLDLNLSLWKPEGAFYVLPRVKNAEKVMSELYFQHQIIVYNGSWFGADNHIRLSYALDEKKILEGLVRLKKYFTEHPACLLEDKA